MSVIMKNATVVLADGDFPKRGGKAREILSSAARVVACDGAAAAYRRVFSRWPDFTVGDMDSLSSPPPGALVDRSEDVNDLTKAISFCRAKGWKKIVIVGAAGKREDHTIANVYIALDAGIPVVTDFGVFHPVCGKSRIKTFKGAGVSVFAPDAATRMTSRGLVWPLDGVRFITPYCATSNRASRAEISVTSDRPAFVYVQAAPAAKGGK